MNVVKRVAQLMQELPEQVEKEMIPTYEAEIDQNNFDIVKVADGWRVTGKSIERAADMTYWEYYQSIRRFQKILEILGIEKALIEAGVKPGDTVFIGEHELVWE